MVNSQCLFSLVWGVANWILVLRLIGQFILNMVALLFSASVHESAHAWMSSYFGDDLARSQGRISLNPVAHIDPIGTLLISGDSIFHCMLAASLIGWGKPTPVNPLALAQQAIGQLLGFGRGHHCNFIMAIIAGIAIRLLYSFGVIDMVREAWFRQRQIR